MSLLFMIAKVWPCRFFICLKKMHVISILDTFQDFFYKLGMKSHIVSVKIIILFSLYLCYSWWLKFDHAGSLFVWKKCIYFYIRYRSGFFLQVGHEITYGCSENHHFYFAISLLFMLKYDHASFLFVWKSACKYVLCMHVSYHFNLFRNQANLKLWNMIYFFCPINNPNEGALLYINVEGDSQNLLLG